MFSVSHFSARDSLCLCHQNLLVNVCPQVYVVVVPLVLSQRVAETQPEAAPTAEHLSLSAGLEWRPRCKEVLML